MNFFLDIFFFLCLIWGLGGKSRNFEKLKKMRNFKKITKIEKNITTDKKNIF